MKLRSVEACFVATRLRACIAHVWPDQRARMAISTLVLGDVGELFRCSTVDESQHLAAASGIACRQCADHVSLTFVGRGRKGKKASRKASAKTARRFFAMAFLGRLRITERDDGSLVARVRSFEKAFRWSVRHRT